MSWVLLRQQREKQRGCNKTQKKATNDIRPLVARTRVYRNNTKTYFHKNTEGKRVVMVVQNFGVPHGMSVTSKARQQHTPIRGQRDVISRPKDRVARHHAPPNSEEAKPSLSTEGASEALRRRAVTRGTQLPTRKECQG